MNVFCLILRPLMILVIIKERRVFANLDTLTLQIHYPVYSETVEFIRANRALANKFLPVWMTTGIPMKEFKKLDIMRDVGEFTLYQDTCTKSAIVYFHKWGEIHGVFDVKYYVKGLRINEADEVHHLDHRLLLEVADDRRELFDIRTGQSIKRQDTTQTSQNFEEIFYPELLIVINHRTHQFIEKYTDLPPGVATVFHMLTVYNAADMLFRLLPSPNIQLNIAGIVIEGKPGQWDFESEVITDPESYYINPQETYVVADLVPPKVSKYFWLWQNNFPRHSYDFIHYLTESPLKLEDGSNAHGLTVYPLPTQFMFPPDYAKDRITTIVRIFGSYEHFITIAHETAHMFDVDHDGWGDHGHLFDVKSCGDTIMSTAELCSRDCLKWSPQAIHELNNYFRHSMARCNLMNYPRSLDKPKPKVIFSVRSQCECYGFESLQETGISVRKHECTRPLRCKKRDSGEELEVPLPMDGTPCARNKLFDIVFSWVCWNKKCVKG